MEVGNLSVDGFPVAAKDVQYAIASLDRTASLYGKSVCQSKPSKPDWPY
jgi:hypothetical protein